MGNIFEKDTNIDNVENPLQVDENLISEERKKVQTKVFTRPEYAYLTQPKEWEKKPEIRPDMIPLSKITNKYDLLSNKSVNGVLKKLGYNVTMIKGTELGRGGFGYVWAAFKEENPSKLLACKEISIEKGLTDDLINELYVLVRCQHPNIVNCLDHFIIGKKLFIFMERGKESLSNIFTKRKEKHPVDTVRKWFYQVVDAIHYMHQLSIAHSDLKLGNAIIFDVNGEKIVKLIDFGLSRVSFVEGGGIHTQKWGDGTPHFMSPEAHQNKLIHEREKGFPQLFTDEYLFQLLAEYTPGYVNVMRRSRYDPFASDIWSLGVMLYVMLSGDYPFPDVHNKKNKMLLHKLHHKLQIQRKFNCSWWKSSNFDSDCQEFLKSMMEPVPNLRIPIEEVKNHIWFKPLIEKNRK